MRLSNETIYHCRFVKLGLSGLQRVTGAESAAWISQWLCPLCRYAYNTPKRDHLWQEPIACGPQPSSVNLCRVYTQAEVIGQGWSVSEMLVKLKCQTRRWYTQIHSMLGCCFADRGGGVPTPFSKICLTWKAKETTPMLIRCWQKIETCVKSARKILRSLHQKNVTTRSPIFSWMVSIAKF